jgi:hypothetical protein
MGSLEGRGAVCFLFLAVIILILSLTVFRCNLIRWYLYALYTHYCLLVHNSLGMSNEKFQVHSVSSGGRYTRLHVWANQVDDAKLTTLDKYAGC